MGSMDVGALRGRGGRLTALLPGLLGTLLLALACNLALELVRMTAVDGVPWRYKSATFVALFLLGSLVVWVLVGLVHAVTGRLRYTVAVMALLTLLVALADWKKVRLRGEPLYPIDWSLADELGSWREIAGPVTTFLVVAGGSAAALALGLGLAWWARRRGRRPAGVATDPTATRRRLALRLGTGAACVLLLGQVTQFNEPGNQVRAGFETAGAVWRPWSQQRNYLGNGFVAGYLYNIDVPPMASPPGYSDETMARIVARYEALARSVNADRDPDRLGEVNVVMILSESFSDPTAVRGVRLQADPIPRIREVMGSTTSGSMLSQNLGGGTANMEFEAVTGMSMGLMPPQLQVPYLMLVPRFEHFPSAVRSMEAAGYRSLAIHPFTSELYRRIEVYRAFGFDELVFDEDLALQQRIGNDGYLSDEAAYTELLTRLERSPEAMFVNLVTMQNHIPYAGRYPDPVPVAGPDGEPMDDLGHYVRGLTHTDRATHRLLNRLAELDEDTVVVFYGDHLPGSYPEDVMRANEGQTLHETPFFVWSTTGGPTRRQPLTSPAFFLDLALEQADVPVTPYVALLHGLRQEVPALSRGRTYDATGQPTPATSLGPRARRLLRDYRLVQFDLTEGDHVSEARMFGETVSLSAVNGTTDGH